LVDVVLAIKGGTLQYTFLNPRQSSLGEFEYLVWLETTF